jgi:hypothetical protein
MQGGRDLVLIWIQGSTGFDQWISNLANPFGFFHSYNVNSHDGFYQAGQKVEDSFAAYLKRHSSIDINSAFIAGCSYSRGAGISDLVFGDGEVAGIKFGDDQRSVVYNFATPDTVYLDTRSKVPWIQNVVCTTDPVAAVLPGWGKKGTTIGYEYDQDIMRQFYGGTAIGEWWATANPINIYEGYAHCHVIETYIAHIFSQEPNLSQVDSFSPKPKWVINIHCPTNVKIIRDGDIVASVIDNVATYKDPDVFITTNDDGEKDIIVPDDGSYQIIVEATDDGTMNVLNNHIGTDDQEAWSTEFKTYTLVDKQVYEISPTTGEPVLTDGQSDFTTVSPSGGSNIVNPSGDQLSLADIIGRVVSVGVAVAFVILVTVISIAEWRKRKKTSNYR